MEYQQEEKKSFSGENVKVLGETYEAGEPVGEGVGIWRNGLKSRAEMLSYLRSCERYWYGEEGFGSEKRKNPA
jgi:hypothetical protein